jgi:NADH dehydrogenase/putative oxidoreductase
MIPDLRGRGQGEGRGLGEREAGAAALSERAGRSMAAAAEWYADLAAALERGLWPLLDLLIRLWLVQAFWLEGMHLAMNWDTALTLARQAWPVPGIDPVLAAWLGVMVEIAGSVLLALGLATRLGALLLLALSLANYAFYQALDVTLFKAVLLGWYVAAGPGPIALDRLLGRGLAATAIPFAAAIRRWYALSGEHAVPVYLLILRLWAVIAILRAGLPETAPGAWAEATAAAVFLCSALLVIGLAMRLAVVPLLALILAALAETMQPGIAGYVFLMLLLLLGLGPGPLSLDRLAGIWLRRHFPTVQQLSREEIARLPKVVIVGAGFGGLAAARALRRTPCDVTLIDRRNYHLFQPLLYQVATAGLSPADIASPIRSMVRDQTNVRTLLARVTDVDTERKEVRMGEASVPYDYLVLATGARHSYFGKDDWEPYAPGLKKIDDATDIRRRILLAFERAENAGDPAVQQALMTFVVVGGGPTGVELAGAIAELAKVGMEREFRNIDPASARVLLIQSAPRLLPPFPESLSEIARQSLERLGVEVRTGAKVEEVDGESVTMAGERIPARTVFWAAGVAASPAARWVGGEKTRSGQLKVGPDLSVPGLAGVFAIGDTAHAEAWDGKPVPGLAPAAKQGGAYVARVIAARIAGRPPPEPFRYRHMGSLATIGRKAAVADFGRIRLSGAVAWWLWGLVHVYFLVGTRNRMSVALEWFWAYLTFRRSIRLITGDAT